MLFYTKTLHKINIEKEKIPKIFLSRPNHVKWDPKKHHKNMTLLIVDTHLEVWELQYSSLKYQNSGPAVTLWGRIFFFLTVLS